MSQQVDPSRIPELKAVVSMALEAAAAAGATQAEADASLQQGFGVTVRLGEVETVEYQRDRGLGITVYFGHRKGSASTADFGRIRFMTPSLRPVRSLAIQPKILVRDLLSRNFWRRNSKIYR